jgi:hypothetical protein
MRSRQEKGRRHFSLVNTLVPTEEEQEQEEEGDEREREKKERNE